MYRKVVFNKSLISCNNLYDGESIERKISRVMESKEPIGDEVKMIYTERKDGVLPQYDVRTDRFDIAIDAMSKIDASNKAKRQDRLKPFEVVPSGQSVQDDNNI